MPFTIKVAEPAGTPVLVGLVGPSGSGKTKSALRLGSGIQSVVGGDLGMIDTEGKRALRFAREHKFKHLSFEPPFSSDRYAEAIAAMRAAGCKTIIVDSTSHEHEGQGGYLEFHEAELDRMVPEPKDYKKRQKMTFTAWIKPAAARRRLINAFLQADANFIFCFRAKEKLKIVTGGEPVPLGWQAIAGDEFVYEMQVRALLLPGAVGVPDWSTDAFAHGTAKLDDRDRHIFPEGAQLSEAMGRQLALEASGEKAETVAAGGLPPLNPDMKAMLDLGKQAAEGGTGPLAIWWKRLRPGEQKMLLPYRDDLKKDAAEAEQHFATQQQPEEQQEL